MREHKTFLKEGKKPKKKQTKIKPTKKYNNRKAAVTKAYAEIAEERENFCEGCGGRWIEHSHTLSQREFPQYAADKENILRMCRQCHLRTENFDWNGLNCEQQMIEYVLRVEPTFLDRQENLRRKDRILIVEEERIWLTNNANLQMLNANSDGTIQILDLEENKTLDTDNEPRKMTVIEKHFLRLLKEHNLFEKLQKVRT